MNQPPGPDGSAPPQMVERRKHVEASLQQSEERHRDIIQTAMDGFWLTDTRGRLLEVNAAYCRMSGYSEQELLAMSVADLEADETREAIARRIQSVVSAGEMRFETRHRRKDGDLFEIEVSAKYRPVEGGRMVIFLRDITERKRAEESLRKSEEKFAKAFLASPEAITITSMEDGKYVEVNDVFLRKTGFRRDEVIGRTSIELGIWVDAADRQRFLEELTAKGALRDFAVSYRMHSGEIRDYLVSGEQIEIEGKTCILTFAFDITERNRAEEERVRLEAQLRQAQKMESVGRLAGGVAHDYNNMLGVILGNAEMALSQVDPADPVHADLQEIIQAAERSARITRQLLTFARKQIVAPKVLDLNETVAGIQQMLARLIGEDIQLDWQPGPDLWPVRVDPSQIDQIVANLCINARDAIAGTGRIAIETGNVALSADDCAGRPGLVPGEYVRLSVQDDGCGIDAAVLPHIFEPFFTTKGIGEGTGLGLSMVYGAVQQNNGFITAESEPGKGTTFTIYLPRHLIEVRPLEKAARPGAPPGGRETILVVEDEPAILSLATRMLEKQGYAVLAAKSPTEAERLARDHADRIHLLVTDVIMPGVNGLELWRRLSVLRPGLKCLFISGYPAHVIAERGILAPGTHFIQKPFTRKDLGLKVQEVLNR